MSAHRSTGRRRSPAAVRPGGCDGRRPTPAVWCRSPHRAARSGLNPSGPRIRRSRSLRRAWHRKRPGCGCGRPRRRGAGPPGCPVPAPQPLPA
ncbi:hypothetical protein E6U81_30465 [Streptomyces sp. A0592]|nr:hypothetical protein E6U81_30465 [Streptomyces sp. A0592]